VRRTPPWFILVAGINGAGKTTFAQNPATLRQILKVSDAERFDVINPDTRTRQLQARWADLAQDRANLLAAELCEGEVWRRLAQREGHFAIETVLSSEKYKPIVTTALRLRWRFHFIYVALADVEIAIERVKGRVAQGGHAVPAEKIRARWPRTLANLPWFWERATSAALYLNASGGQVVQLATKVRGATRLQRPELASHATAPLQAMAGRGGRRG
jgi:predicted ABC-type ATPase